MFVYTQTHIEANCAKVFTVEPMYVNFAMIVKSGDEIAWVSGCVRERVDTIS